jgi:mannosyltransferase OCH1-like enzyme
MSSIINADVLTLHGFSTSYENTIHKEDKIMHHMFKTSDEMALPKHWRKAFQKCRTIHRARGWKSILWTDESIRLFISNNYNWFLPTYDSYPFWIQRVDSARYFILYHYGGVYLDMDVMCVGSFEPIYKIMISKNLTAILPKTKPVGYSNDVIFARKHSEFMESVIHSLNQYNRRYGFDYLTVMMSTGPLFLTHVLNHEPDKIKKQVGILSPDIYSPEKGYTPIPIFRHTQGNSWHGNDIKIIFWVQRNLIYFSLLAFVIFLFRRVSCTSKRKKLKSRIIPTCL